MEDICHRYECTVSFSDTDASGRVHFTRILTYAEQAEHDFLRKVGIKVFSPETVGWPRVRVACDYRLPLSFQERIEVRLAVAKVGKISITWKFEIANSDGQLAASGEMVVVKVNGAGEAEAVSDGERRILEGLA